MNTALVLYLGMIRDVVVTAFANLFPTHFQVYRVFAVEFIPARQIKPLMVRANQSIERRGNI